MSPDGNGNPFFRFPALQGWKPKKRLKRTAGSSSKKNTILNEIFRYIYATNINL